MIELYTWTTPNGFKPLILLEEAGIPYNIHKVDISKNEQFKPAFIAISPNNKIPAIIDTEPTDGIGPQAVFESGAILWYLAEKSGQYIPSHARGKIEVSQWLFWQVGGLGPMLGQNHHFSQYAPEKIPYAIKRYKDETRRLYGVLDKRLVMRDFFAGDYSIADMAIYPWLVPYEKQGIALDDFPHVKRWYEMMATRPAVKSAYALSKKINPAS